MRNRTLKLSGYEFHHVVNIQFFDMSLIACEPGCNKQWYLFFNPSEDTATVDDTMPEWYKKLAILTEAIAYGKVHKPEIEAIRKKSPSSRITAERYCLIKTPRAHRKTWLNARYEYYNFRINHILDEREKHTFEEAREFIARLIDEDQGATVEYLKFNHEYYETSYFLTSFADKVDDPRRKWLVYFTTDGHVFLDKTSPKWYRKLAALAEEMGMAEKYPELLGNEKVAKLQLCAEVEKAILDRFTNKRTYRSFIEARIELFELLLETKLNTGEDIKMALGYLRLLHLRLRETP